MIILSFILVVLLLYILNCFQKQEIERLNKKIEQYENPEDMTLMFMWCDEKAKDEIKRLNNIIKTKDEGIKAFTEDLCEESTKIEKAIEHIEKHTENIDRGQYYEDYVETYPVLQILKGEDKFIEYANGERIEWFIYPSWLNEEVEVIEDKKIEKIGTIYFNETPTEAILHRKIEEIIDYINKE